MLVKKWFWVVVLLAGGVVGCQGQGGDAVEEENTAVSHLETMLAYLPAEWADIDLPVAFGPAIHFIDVEQLREDVGIGPVTGASDPAEKRELAIQLGLNIQGIAYAPESIQPAAGNAFGEWGWDIADVQQILYLPDLGAAIYKGNFGRPEIEGRLLEKGYTSGTVEDFDVFTFAGDLPTFALTSETLIAGGASGVGDMVQFISSGDPGMDSHPAVRGVLNHLDGVWGAVLAPSPDLVGYSDQIDQQMELMDEAMRETLEERFPSSETKPVVWDFMAIGFQGVERSSLTFVYHYPSGSEAGAAVPVVERFLTETPLISSPGATWSSLMTVQEVRGEDSVVVATAETEVRGLIGNAFKERDFFAFLPVK